MANNTNAATAAIAKAAAKYGLDPKAMEAVAHAESGLRPDAVGDGGHAFGLFQFNNEGGVITGQAHPERYLDPNFNAMEAARHMATIPGLVGAKGQTAINLMVTKFERPANPGGEVARASNYYKGISPETISRAAQYSNVLSDPSVTSPKTTSGGGGSGNSSGGFDPSQALLGYLLNQSTPAKPGNVDPTNELTNLMGMMTQQEQTGQPAVTGLGQNQNGKVLPLVRETNTPPDGTEAKIVSDAKKFLGTPYSWGGGSIKGPTKGTGKGANTVGFDCSSFIQYVQHQNGVDIPRTTYQQLKAGRTVSKNQLQPGDAVFFNKGEHVGMYIGNGKFIQAPHTGDVVKISDLNSYPGFYTAKRFGK